MVGAVQLLDSMDGEQVAAYAFDVGAHSVEQAAELLHVWFAGGVVDGGVTVGQAGRHDDVGGAGDGGFVQKHIGTAQTLGGGEVVGVDLGVVFVCSAEVHEAFDVGVHPAAADFVSARFWEPGFAEAGQERAADHHRAAERGAELDELGAAHVVAVEGGRLEGVFALFVTGYRYPHLLEEPDKVLHVQDFRNVGDAYRLVCEKHCAEDLQRLVLCTLRSDASAQPVPAFDDEC